MLWEIGRVLHVGLIFVLTLALAALLVGAGRVLEYLFVWALPSGATALELIRMAIDVTTVGAAIVIIISGAVTVGVEVVRMSIATIKSQKEAD